MKSFLLLVFFAIMAMATAQVHYQRTDDGRLYSDVVHLALYDETDGNWNIGPVVSSDQLQEGSYIWFPDQDYSPQMGKFGMISGAGNTMRVVRIENHNVTAGLANCCVGVTVSVGTSHIQCQATA